MRANATSTRRANNFLNKVPRGGKGATILFGHFCRTTRRKVQVIFSKIQLLDSIAHPQDTSALSAHSTVAYLFIKDNWDSLEEHCYFFHPLQRCIQIFFSFIIINYMTGSGEISIFAFCILLLIWLDRFLCNSQMHAHMNIY